MAPESPDNQQLTALTLNSRGSGGTVTPAYTNVRAGGQLIAHYDLSGSQDSLYFHFRDWLRTLRVLTDAGGNLSPNGDSRRAWRFAPPEVMKNKCGSLLRRDDRSWEGGSAVAGR